MVTFDCRAERVDGVTLVTATVGDVAAPTRITVQNRLEGPVWPPRQQGAPTAGWTESGFEAVVEAGTHALGYATPAEPDDPPAELVAAEPAPEAPPTDEQLNSDAAVLRELGDPSPPADAVPTAEPAEAADSQTQRGDCSGSPSELAPQQPEPERVEASVEASTEFTRTDDQQLPATVSQWLETVARRVDRAEQLDEVDSLSEATAAVRAADGLAGVQAVAARGDADEQMLRALARRAGRLADRRAAVTVPTETLSRLA